MAEQYDPFTGALRRRDSSPEKFSRDLQGVIASCKRLTMISLIGALLSGSIVLRQMVQAKDVEVRDVNGDGIQDVVTTSYTGRKVLFLGMQEGDEIHFKEVTGWDARYDGLMQMVYQR